MKSLVLVVPGRLETRTGGYGYDRRIVAGLTARGWSAEVLELNDSFPRPTSLAREAAARALASIPDGATVLVDGFVRGTWKTKRTRGKTTLEIEALEPLAKKDRDALAEEGELLLRFMAEPEGAGAFEVRFVENAQSIRSSP